MTDSFETMLDWKTAGGDGAVAGDYWVAHSDKTNEERRYAVLYKGTEIRPRRRTLEQAIAFAERHHVTQLRRALKAEAAR